MPMRTQARITGADIHVLDGLAYLVLRIALSDEDMAQPEVQYMMTCPDLSMFLQFMRGDSFQALRSRAVVMEKTGDDAPWRLVGPVVRFVPLVQKDDEINWQ